MSDEIYDPEIIDNDYNNAFPPKPEESKPKPNAAKSFFSLVLFIAAFHLFFSWSIVTIAIVVLAVIIHELGHFLAMKLFNYKDLTIFFLPLLGAVASGEKEEISQKQKVTILLAGPLPGIIIGTIFIQLGIAYDNTILSEAGNIFLFINLFNLLPIMPLDGGKVIKTLFFSANEIINKIFIIISIFLLAGFAVYTDSYIMLLVPLFLTMQLNGQTQINKVRTAVISKGIIIDTTYENLPDRDYWLIRDEIAKNIKAFRNIIAPTDYNISPFESKIMKQVKSIINKKPKQDIGAIGKIFVVLLWTISIIAPFYVIAYYYSVTGIL